MAKDFLGKNIEVGDDIVFAQKNYRNFLRGKIIKITDKMVLIQHEEKQCQSQTRQEHSQVIKI